MLAVQAREAFTFTGPPPKHVSVLRPGGYHLGITLAISLTSFNAMLMYAVWRTWWYSLYPSSPSFLDLAH